MKEHDKRDREKKKGLSKATDRRDFLAKGLSAPFVFTIGGSHGGDKKKKKSKGGTIWASGKDQKKRRDWQWDDWDWQVSKVDWRKWRPDTRENA